MRIDQLSKEMRANLRGRNIFLLWSGGTDSNLLLKTILYNRIYEDCNLNVVTIVVPSNIYNLSRINNIRYNLYKLGINFDILQPEDKMLYSIQASKACLLCKEIRRKEFIQYYLPRKHNGDLIITGHNLSDLMAYYTEMCIFQLQGNPVTETRERFLEVANKFLPIYQTEICSAIYRPLLEYSQEFISQYLKIYSNCYGIDIVEQDCLWKTQRKRLLQEYFIKSCVVSNFTKTCGMFKDMFGFPTEKEFRELSFDTYLV